MPSSPDNTLDTPLEQILHKYGVDKWIPEVGDNFKEEIEAYIAEMERDAWDEAHRVGRADEVDELLEYLREYGKDEIWDYALNRDEELTK